MHWHQYTKTQIEKELDTNLERGLSAKEARLRLLKFGPNLLPEQPPERWLKVFLRQFKSPLIYVLLFCAAIIFGLGEINDSFIILAVLAFNAGIGAYQEGKSSRTLRSLKRLSASEAAVIRGGREEVVPEREIVPGDLLVLREGQKVAADARVIFSSNLGVDEAAMTGETGAVLKRDSAISGDAPVLSQNNMVFKGTNVLTGSGLAIAAGTGVNTEIGKISRALLEPETEIPLQRNIKKLAKIIIYAISAISAALFIFGIFSGRPPREMFAVVVSLAVSMIPEGLPLVLTLILVTGVWRMSKKNALVKKMQAVEALGQADVIAVDKTGTLTKNEMAVKQLFLAGKIIQVTGNGYEPKGAALFLGQSQAKDVDVQMVGKIAALSSKASVVYSKSEGQYKVAGDPTEAAVAVFGEKLGFIKEEMAEKDREAAEIVFDYKTKHHAVFYQEQGDGIFCAIAGAPEVLLNKASHFLHGGQSHKLTAEFQKKFEQALVDFSSRGLRTVAVGFRRLSAGHKLDAVEDITLAGLFAIEDSTRPEVLASVKKAQRAGVKVVMITGDHKITAKAIAREAGIYREGDLVITGSELIAMDHKQLAAKLNLVSVFARVTPEDKMKIIKAYKEAGLIIAMTGDGVNDAPSLVAADLGVAMGKIGTDVAKEAADIVLLNDNLSSIVAAIEEGRAMYKNIQKALMFLFSTSLGELLAIAGALFLRMPLPVLAVQILWLNLITDPLIGMALALDKKEPNLLERKQEKLPKYFITPAMIFQMALIGAVMAAGTLYLFSLFHPVDYWKSLSISLTALAVYQWYNGFNSQFLNSSIFTRQIFRNVYLWAALAANFGLQMLALYSRPMQNLLKTTPLDLGEWIMILGVAFSVILAEEARKFLYRIWRK